MSYFDDNEDWIIYGSPRSQRKFLPPKVDCARCGARGLYWINYGKWILVDDTGPHVCNEDAIRAKTLDDFDSL